MKQIQINFTAPPGSFFELLWVREKGNYLDELQFELTISLKTAVDVKEKGWKQYFASRPFN